METAGTTEIRMSPKRGVESIVDAPEGHHLLVASTGGHLTQLVKWSRILGSSPDSLWVTFKSPQSESLLSNNRVLHVPYVAPRDLRGTATAFRRIMRQIDWKEEGFVAAITTGAALGLAGLAASRFHGVPTVYIESVSRVNGPSLTGRIVSLDPSTRSYCQHAQWAGGRWKYGGCLFDEFRTIEKTPTEAPRLFITLGTIRPYRFDALVDSILKTGLADDRTVWQLGVTVRSGLPGMVLSQIGAVEFEQYARSADVVISHAGVGTLMSLLEMGVYPIAVPRRRVRNEHVDDHQSEIAGLLAARGLATVAEADHINKTLICSASAKRIELGGDDCKCPSSFGT